MAWFWFAVAVAGWGLAFWFLAEWSAALDVVRSLLKLQRDLVEDIRQAIDRALR